MVSEDQRQKFGLMSAEKYFYLNQGGSCIIDGKSDKDDFQNLLSAMQVFWPFLDWTWSETENVSHLTYRWQGTDLMYEKLSVAPTIYF